MPDSFRYLGRQAIVDRQQQLVAYELLFRSSPANFALVRDDLLASAEVLRNAFGELGNVDVLGQFPGFINASADLLQDRILDQLPAERLVLEILETVTVTDELLLRMAQLRARGFRLALDDVVHLGADQMAMLPLVDIVKVDVAAVEAARLPALKAQLDGFDGILLAEKVDSHAQFERCCELGFDWFQGYFHSRPVVLSSADLG
ncbi:EAL and HDOD domain-containing protein [Chromobacterium sp.]|uniref:EAL and HDOD domain-containing protein n=1 Tax=Chromobacterium sp. TaxID=306190 RepID=UPI0035AF3E9D